MKEINKEKRILFKEILKPRANSFTMMYYNGVKVGIVLHSTSKNEDIEDLILKISTAIGTAKEAYENLFLLLKNEGFYNSIKVDFGGNKIEDDSRIEYFTEDIEEFKRILYLLKNLTDEQPQPQKQEEIKEIKEEIKVEQVKEQTNKPAIYVEVEGIAIPGRSFNKINLRTNSQELIKELKGLNKSGFKEDKQREGYLLGWSNIYTCSNLKRILKKLNLKITTIESNIIGFDIIDILKEVTGENTIQEAPAVVIETVEEQKEEIRKVYYKNISNMFFVSLLNDNNNIKSIRKINQEINNQGIKNKFNEIVKFEKPTDCMYLQADYILYIDTEEKAQKILDIVLNIVNIKKNTPIIIKEVKEEIKEEAPAITEEIKEEKAEAVENIIVKEEVKEESAVIINNDLLKELIKRVNKLEKENEDLKEEIEELKGIVKNNKREAKTDIKELRNDLTEDIKELEERIIDNKAEEGTAVVIEEVKKEEKENDIKEMFNVIMKELKEIKEGQARGDKKEIKEEEEKEGNFAGAIKEEAPANIVKKIEITYKDNYIIGLKTENFDISHFTEDKQRKIKELEPVILNVTEDFINSFNNMNLKHRTESFKVPADESLLWNIENNILDNYNYLLKVDINKSPDKMFEYYLEKLLIDKINEEIEEINKTYSLLILAKSKRPKAKLNLLGESCRDYSSIETKEFISKIK